MKCPVCKTEIDAHAQVCFHCGFSELGTDFVTAKDAEEWMQNTVIPYREKWQKDTRAESVLTDNGDASDDDPDFSKLLHGKMYVVDEHITHRDYLDGPAIRPISFFAKYKDYDPFSEIAEDMGFCRVEISVKAHDPNCPVGIEGAPSYSAVCGTNDQYDLHIQCVTQAVNTATTRAIMSKIGYPPAYMNKQRTILYVGDEYDYQEFQTDNQEMTQQVFNYITLLQG